MILNYCKKEKKKSFLPYCPKLYGAGLEPRTFEFVTYRRYRLLIDSQVLILDELSALNVHYFPTYPRKVLDENKKLWIKN